MASRSAKRGASILGAVVLVASLLVVNGVLSLDALRGSGIAVLPDAVFRPSDAWVDITFSTEQRFLNRIEVGSDFVRFDDISFGVQKLPRGLPRATVTISTWAPHAPNGTEALDFLAESPADSTLWFNISGLPTDVLHDVYVDEGWQANTSGGRVSFQTAPISRTVRLVTRNDRAVANATAPARIADLHLVSFSSDIVLLQWTAPRVQDSGGQAAAYELRYDTNGTLTDANFTAARLIPTTPPSTAGTVEQVAVTGLSPQTRYWFGVRARGEAGNWSQVSNSVDLVTAWLSSADSPPTPSGNQTTIDRVLVTPAESQLDVTFGEPMNRTSVEASLVLEPPVSYSVEWVNDTHLVITIDEGLSEGGTYALAIDSEATDFQGDPLGEPYVFRFVTPVARAPIVEPTPFPTGTLIVGLVGLGAASALVFFAFPRGRGSAGRIQNAALTLARELEDLREGRTSVRDVARRLNPIRRFRK